MIYRVWATIPSGSHLPYRKALCITASFKLPVLYVQHIYMSNTAAAEFRLSAETTSVNKNELRSACGSIVCGDLGAATLY